MSTRRLSTSSSSSGSSSPRLTPVDSSSALILVHDPEEVNTPFDFSSDDEDGPFDPQFEIRRASIPPLSPSIVFLYSLSPYLKLGALLLPNANLPLKFGIPALCFFAVLSAFARQIWYMLARYLRKADMEDVILDAFARGKGRERRREIIRTMTRGCTGSLRVLLATIYLRESVHVLLPILPERLPLPTNVITTVVLAAFLTPLTGAQSLASKRLVYSTGISIVTFIAWLGLATYAHGSPDTRPSWLRLGPLWQGITSIAFTFTSSSTLPLYASLKGTTQLVTTAKTPKTRSFKFISVSSVVIAILLTLPLTFFSPHSGPTAQQTQLQRFTASLNAITLLLTIPAIIITTPSIPIPARIRQSTIFSLSKLITFILVILLSLMPAMAFAICGDILLVAASLGTYFLPALVHVTTHFFKRPLSIILPPGTPSPHSPSAEDGPSTPLPVPSQDELLQRKERALQKRQFRKRIVWDIGVWILLVPVSGGGLLWAGGRIAKRW